MKKNTVEKFEREAVSLSKMGSFWFLMLAQFSEQIADSINLIILLATLLVAFHGNASPANFCVFAPTLIPAFLIGPFAGVFVDRMSKRRLLLAAAVGRGVLIAGMAALAPGVMAGSRPSLVGMMAMVFLVSCLWQFYNPARSAALPEVVPARHLEVANSVSVTVLLVMQIFGYLVGGLLGDNFNPAKALWFNAACYTLTTFFLLFVRFHPPQAHLFQKLSVSSVRQELIASLKALFSPSLQVSTAAMSVVILLIGAGLAFPNLKDFSSGLVFPQFMNQLDAWTAFHYGLQVGPLTRFTLLLLMGAVGAGVGVLILNWVKESIDQIRLIQICLIFCGLFMTFLSQTRSFSVASVFMAGVGMGGMLVKALAEARIQKRISAHMRGKVLSAYFMACGVAAIGAATLPGVYQHVLNPPSPRAWLTICGLLVFVFALISMAFTWLTRRGVKYENS